MERKKAENIRSVLYDISKAVNSTKGLDELFYSIHQSLGQILDATNFSIAIYDKKKDIINVPYFSDEKRDEFVVIKNASQSGSVNARVIKSKKTLLLKEEKREEIVGHSKVQYH